MSDALARAKELVEKGCVRYSFHARVRMDERNASERDVCNAIRSASQADYNVAKDNYRLSGGADLDGDPMTVVVAIEADCIIITIF